MMTSALQTRCDHYNSSNTQTLHSLAITTGTWKTKNQNKKKPPDDDLGHFPASSAITTHLPSREDEEEG